MYPSGLIRELEIENGRTLTFTKAGEYTITAYVYDTKGMKLRRLEGEKGIPNLPMFQVRGIMGEPGYYSSDVTIQVRVEAILNLEVLL